MTTTPKIKKGMTLGDAEQEFRAAFKRTPDLEQKVRKIVDEAIALGWELKPGTYREPEHFACALGAISLGADPNEREENFDRRQVFALSLKALGCSPLELDSIEAGFECWNWNRMSNEGWLSDASLTWFIYDEVAYDIGKRMRIEHVGDIGEAQYENNGPRSLFEFYHRRGAGIEELRHAVPSLFDLDSYRKGNNQ